ncbi:MAG: helix-turn-helix transcriptional regulator [Armatimonadetes bacterium]|nr:helix-turn-helix transcriptional regulator [Armatimonadota bacterium]
MHSGQDRCETGTPYSELLRLLGCKWSIAILAKLESNVRRPGALSRSIPGLSARVMHRCLELLLASELIERTNFGEVPPKVEYCLTPKGEQFLRVVGHLDQIVSS